jgi:hypothetical protein
VEEEIPYIVGVTEATPEGQSNWNRVFDTSYPNDNVIGERDLSAFAQHRLKGI